MKNLMIIVYILVCLYACKEEQETVNFDSKISLEEHALKSGDIIFQTSTSSQSKAIQLATDSKYSHVGIILNKGRKVFVLEAVQPVKLTPIKTWIARGKNKNYIVKRLKSSANGFNEKEEKKMIKEGKKHLNKNYDLAFEWSNKKMYCSELVWKIYKEALDIELSNLKQLSDFNIENEVVNKKLKERYGKHIPLNEKVVSPSDIFESELLFTVLPK